ncbi:hypothetical protein [Paenibacillus senegalensis]|nr:hypothetical protein [Paenibacillus senegalensis]
MKKQTPYMKRKQPEEVNKKGLIWAGSIFGAVAVLMIVLLIVNG